MNFSRTPPASLLWLTLAISAAAHADIVVEDRPLSAAKPAPAVASSAIAPVAGTPATGSVEAPTTVKAEPAAASESVANPAWDSFQQIQQLQEELRRLQGAVEEQTHLIEKLQTDLRTRYTDLDQRFTALQEQTRQAASASTDSATPAAATTAPSATIEDEKKAYLAAYEVFRAGGPDKAIAPMLAFVKRYPNSTFTPGAHYWLGEFYLNANTPDQAAAWKQFDTVINQYPEHAKVPASLYKQASILDLQGKPAEARQKMQELLGKYPKSPEAALADSYLKALAAAEAEAAAKSAKTGTAPANKTTGKPAGNKAAGKPAK